jgi:hypothetical protein
LNGAIKQHGKVESRKPLTSDTPGEISAGDLVFGEISAGDLMFIEI